MPLCASSCASRPMDLDAEEPLPLSCDFLSPFFFIFEPRSRLHLLGATRAARLSMVRSALRGVAAVQRVW
eukprot:scaffold427_cov263-Pinguiococcus_pyrenoidosus.AAC.19